MSDLLTSLSEEHPANHSAWRESALAWMTRAATSPLNTWRWRDDGTAYTIEARHHARAVSAPSEQWAVRRLTPRECERLQGFPDDWTQVPYRGKPAADGPRYKAAGNSMAVNVMRWIGQRIAMVEGVKS